MKSVCSITYTVRSRTMYMNSIILINGHMNRVLGCEDLCDPSSVYCDGHDPVNGRLADPVMNYFVVCKY